MMSAFRGRGLPLRLPLPIKVKVHSYIPISSLTTTTRLIGTFPTIRTKTIKSSYPSSFYYSTKLQTADQEEAERRENEKHEAESEKRSSQIRLYKKIFSTVLFSTTIGLAIWARRKKQRELDENFKGTVRVPPDENFALGSREMFRVTSPRTGKPTYVLPAQTIRDGTLNKILTNFVVQPTDVYVASFPKSGTTWVQEIVYLIKNKMDFQKARSRTLENRFPYLEYPYPGLTTVQKLEPPRLIKTHLPYDLLPQGIKNAKVIYVVRDPKDIVVSYYHFVRMLSFFSYKGSFEDFFEKFKNNQLPYTPYFEHINSYLEKDDPNDPDPNLLIIKYEDLKNNPTDVIRKIGLFLDTVLSEEEVEALVYHTSFQQMSKNPSTNYSHWEDFGLCNKNEGTFFRKGIVGDSKNYFSPQNNADFDAWALKCKVTTMP